MDRPLCVYCRRVPADPQWRPFCSERCRMADLGRWLSDGYRVPGPPVPDQGGGDESGGSAPPAGDNDDEHRDG